MNDVGTRRSRDVGLPTTVRNKTLGTVGAAVESRVALQAWAGSDPEVEPASALLADDGVPEELQGDVGSDFEDDTDDELDWESDFRASPAPMAEVSFFTDAGAVRYECRLLRFSDESAQRVAEERWRLLSVIAEALLREQSEVFRASSLPLAFEALLPMSQPQLSEVARRNSGRSASRDPSQISRLGQLIVSLHSQTLVPLDFFFWKAVAKSGSAASGDERRIAEAYEQTLRTVIIAQAQDPGSKCVEVARRVLSDLPSGTQLLLAMDAVPRAERADLRNDPLEWRTRATAMNADQWQVAVAHRLAESVRKNHAAGIRAVLEQPEVVERHRKVWPLTNEETMSADLGLEKPAVTVCRLALVHLIAASAQVTTGAGRPVSRGVWS